MGRLSYGGNARDAVGKVKLDPRLADIVATAAAASPYNVRIISEVRPKGSTALGNHDNGYAIDVQLQDPQTGKWLPNKGTAPGGASAYPAYESFAQLARVAQQQSYPELNNTFRWGGGFRQGGTPFDMMHLDITPGAKGAMAYYNWNSGLNADGRKALPGAESNGGLGNVRVVAQLEQQLAGGLMPPGDIPSLESETGIGKPLPIAPVPMDRPAALSDQYLTGDAGLGYGTAPPLLPAPAPLPADLASQRAAAVPLPAFSPGLSTRGQPVPALSQLSYRGAIPPLPTSDPRMVLPAMAATGDMSPPNYSTAATALTLSNVAPPLPAGYGSSGLTEAQRNALLAVPMPQINSAQAANDFYSGFGLAPGPNAVTHPATAGDRAAELAAATAMPPQITDQASADNFYSGFGLASPSSSMDAINRAIGVSPAEASTGPLDYFGNTKTADGIAGTVAMPPGARPASLPPLPAPTYGNGGWDQFQLPAPATIPAPPLPRPRPLSADPLAQILAGGAFPSYTGAGSLPDYPTAPTVNSPFSLSLPPPATTDNPGTIIGGLSRNVDPASLQPAANALSGISSFLAPQNNVNGNSSQPFTTNWADPYLSTSMPSAPPSPINHGADLSSLAIPSSVQVPKYVTISKQVPIPSSQPIETGDGVHWDDGLAQYVMNAPAAPAPTRYRTVTQQVPNPEYVAPHVPVPGVAPVVPLSPGQDVLAADRLAAQNPLQRLFGMTPAGHLANFLSGGLTGYGAPQQGGLLGLLGGLGGSSAPAAPSAPTPSQQYAALAAKILATQPNGNVNNDGNHGGPSLSQQAHGAVNTSGHSFAGY